MVALIRRYKYYVLPQLDFVIDLLTLRLFSGWKIRWSVARP